VQAAFDFLKPAVVAIVAGAVVKIGKKSLLSPLHYAVAVTAFGAIYFGNVSFPLIILGAILLGAALHFGVKPGNGTPKNAGWKASADEHTYLINSDTVVAHSGFSATRILRQVGTAVLLWCLPLLLFILFAPNAEFWKKLCLFFSQAALVTFGGAYAVLPYVAQVSVQKFGWLSQLEMLDGLALGETTPGPLIMVLAFVGFMAAYHSFGGSLIAATLGLGATVYYTFLPSFLFIFVGAPLIERSHASPAVKAVLQFATAAVVGVMLSLCLYLGQAVVAPNAPEVEWWQLAWVLVSLAALQFVKINLMVWVGVSAAFGLIRYGFAQIFFPT
jgi:chromate transporter